MTTVAKHKMFWISILWVALSWSCRIYSYVFYMHINVFIHTDKYVSVCAWERDTELGREREMTKKRWRRRQKKRQRTHYPLSGNCHYHRNEEMTEWTNLWLLCTEKIINPMVKSSYFFRSQYPPCLEHQNKSSWYDYRQLWVSNQLVNYNLKHLKLIKAFVSYKYRGQVIEELFPGLPGMSSRICLPVQLNGSTVMCETCSFHEKDPKQCQEHPHNLC